MRKELKSVVISELTEKIGQSSFFYLADSSSLPVSKINKLRRICFEKGIEMQVVKNTLVRKAMEAQENPDQYKPLFDSLHGPTTILFTDVAKLPANVIKDFRGKDERPILKAAYIDAGIYIGDDQLDALANLKSKEELLGEIIGLLQSPAKNVISGLKSGGSKIAGILKTLEERAN